jgi:Ca-activated chloride channel family protein
MADGMILPDPPPDPEPPELSETWLTIRYHRVDVTIANQVAVTRVDQEFVNEYDWEVEGTYLFPLPLGAAVSRFTMWIDGQPLEGEILEADQARRIYEDIVRSRRDPALLEYVGRDAVRARIFPIPPGGSRRIELEYTQVLALEDGMVSYVYPLNTERFSARPLEDCSIRLDIRSQEPIRAVYSPTHHDQVFIDRPGDDRATVGYEARYVLPDQDFELVYTVSQADVGLNLMTFRGDEDAGFFLLLAAPSVDARSDRAIPRDVLLVLDTSGSMEGEKLAQAKDALAYVLQHLNEEDRFNVIAFSTGLGQYAQRLRPASEAAEAAAWVQGLEAIGGTNINRALLEALADAKGERPTLLIFLTDGLPTEGVTEIDQILANVESASSDSLRLFAFGVGDDVNTVLLDSLAHQNRGASGYVRPGERVDEEVSAFYARIRTPLLTDLELDVDNVLLEDVYPYPLPDLYAGSQLIVTGRYRPPSSDSRVSRITLAGNVGGQRREFDYEGVFRSGEEYGDALKDPMSFIPRLWATRKIGHLLTQIRLHGENREWVDAVIELSIRYGIITPYTSFLVEEQDILTEAGRERAVQDYMATPAPDVSGAPAVELAEEEARMREAGSAFSPASVEGALQGGGAPSVVQHIGPKAFVRQDGVWVDTAFDTATGETERIPFGSSAYFDLLASQPGWGKVMALGDRVIFVMDSGDGATAYEIVPEAADSAPLVVAETPEVAQPTDRPLEPSAVTATALPGGTAASSTGRALCRAPIALSGVTLMALVLWSTSRR